MARDTRQRLIDIAHELFYREGFYAVGLDRVLAEVGVTKTTFYNHFESRDELIVAVLQWHDAWWAKTFRQMLRDEAGDDPADQLRALFHVLKEALADQFSGCMFINAAVAFPSPHDPAHQAAAQNQATNESIVRELAKAAGLEDADADKLAKELTLLMEGAFVSVQLTGKLDAADIAGDIAHCVIADYLPEPEASTSDAIAADAS